MLRILIAVAIALVILFVGVLMTRAMSARRIGEDDARPDEPEDVASLAVFFVCAECGTEFQVTRLGEVQVPRHCGEPMDVVRRPAAAGQTPELN